MPALHLRKNFGCTVYSPYLNPQAVSDHLLTIELGWFICALIHVILAVRNKRVFTLIGIYIFGAMFETIGFFNHAMSHNQFRVQLTCFLPLKEVFWYGNTMFMALLVSEHSGIKSKFVRIVLMGFISIIQNLPYEMVSTKDNVDNYYVNEIDFPNADFSDKINDASSAVLISYFIMSLTGGLIVFNSQDIYNLVLLPTVGFVSGIILFAPYHWIKYLGCFRFYKAEPNFYAFHMRCVRYSRVKDTPIVALFAVLSVLIISSGLKSQYYKARLDGISQLLIFTVALISHGVILYNMVEGAYIPEIELPVQVTILFSIILAHLGLVFLVLSPWQSSKEKAE